MIRSSVFHVLVALLLAFSMSYYYFLIVPAERATSGAAPAAGHGRFSDFYQCWVATRSLLLQRQDPYAPEVTRQIQRTLFGGILADPSDHAFSYPLFTTFLMWPLAAFPFRAVQIALFPLLLLATAASLWLWARACGVRLTRSTAAIWLLLLISSQGVLEGIDLQQPTLLVAAWLAASAAAAAVGRPSLAGALLAFAMVKPQLALPLAAWFGLWMLGAWRQRRSFAYSFAAVMMILLGAAEAFSHGWMLRWLQVLRDYPRYAGPALLEVLLGKTAAVPATVLIVALAGWTCWKLRLAAAGTHEFGIGCAVVLTSALLVQPNCYAFYNHIVLLPAALLIWTNRSRLRAARGPRRITLLAAMAVLFWPWVTSIVICGRWLLRSTMSVEMWMLPVRTVFAVPFAIGAMLWLVLTMPAAAGRPATAGQAAAAAVKTVGES